MAASWRIPKLSSGVLKLSRLFTRLEPTKAHTFQKNSSLLIYNTFKKYFLLSLVPVASVSATTTDSSDKPFEPNDVRLRSSECLKNAAGLAVDSTSAVLSQTVYSIINVEKEYVELLNVLVMLLEYQMQVLGQKAEEERIADIVIETRHEINKVKQRKQDLALLFASVEKLADATAEVAFATGSSYASTSAGERLYSAQQEVNRNWANSQKAEKEVAYVEAQLIDQITRHEKRMKSKSLKDENKDNNKSNIEMEATTYTEFEVFEDENIGRNDKTCDDFKEEFQFNDSDKDIL